MVPAPLSLVAQAASPNLAFGETYRAVKHEASGRTGGRCWPGVGVPRRPARSRAHTGIIAEVSCCRRRLRVGSWIGGGLKSVGTQPLMSNSETRAKTLITSAFPGRPWYVAGGGGTARTGPSRRQ